MSRGGKRPNSGAKSKWIHRPTVTVRVPEVFADVIRDLALFLDQKESLDLFINYLADKGIESDRPTLLPNAATLATNDDGDIMARGIEGLYYITHIENLGSILSQGILSHSQIEAEGLEPAIIYNSQIIDRRKDRRIDKKSLWEFANLYFQPRNAMLYSLTAKGRESEIVILSLKRNILDKQGIYISMGNAASLESKIYPFSLMQRTEQNKLLKAIRENTDIDWWKKDDGSKRKLMAECLVPQKIPPTFIQGIYVSKPAVRREIQSRFGEKYPQLLSEKLPIVIEPKRFFQPDWAKKIIPDNLWVAKGDMFFARVQTLTISVNCVGVMGKGLASTAKYRFPDVYVEYQDLCRTGQIRPGKPYLYTRESSTFYDLCDEELPSDQELSQTWFLLFPTKNHWRNKSSLEDIEKGLQWLLQNYQRLGIKSLAMPALGCGLGGLSWEQVGPLMCHYLSQMKILTPIYLPADQEVPEEFLTPQFLLS